MNRYWVVPLGLALTLAACGGSEDTSSLRTQVALLQTQVAQPTATAPAAAATPTQTPTATPLATLTPTPLPPTATPTPPIVFVPQPTPVPPTATLIPPPPKRCTYLVIASGPLTPEYAKVLGYTWSYSLRDTVTGKLEGFYGNGPIEVGTCYPEGGYP